MIARRSKMQIYIDILKLLQNSNGRMKKTHIVYKSEGSIFEPKLNYIESIK